MSDSLLTMLGPAPFASGFPIDAIVGAGDGLIVALAQGDIAIYDATSGERVFTRGVTHSSHIQTQDLRLALAVDESCTHLLSAGLDGRLDLTDLVHHNPCWQVYESKTTSDAPLELERFRKLVAVALSPDGNLGAAASEKGVKLWQEGKLVADLAGSVPLVFSRDNNLLLAGNMLHDVDLGVRLVELEGFTESAAFSADGAYLARSAWRHEGRSVEVWALASWTRVWGVAVDRVEALGFSLDGARLAGSGNGRFQVWDAATGAELAAGVFEGRAPFVCNQPFALFGICPFGYRLLRLDLEGMTREKILGHVAPVLALEVDGDSLVSRGEDAVLVWNLVADSPPRSVVASDEPSLSVDVSTRQRRVVLPARNWTLEARTNDWESTGVYLITADHGERMIGQGHRILATSADEMLVVIASNQYISVYHLDRMAVIARLDTETHQPPFRDHPTCATLSATSTGVRIFVGGASGAIYWGCFDPDATECVALQDRKSVV